jgi:hypothetical protein
MTGCIIPAEGESASANSNQPATTVCVLAMCDVQLADRSALAGEGATQKKGDEVTTSTSQQEADIDASLPSPEIKLESGRNVIEKQLEQVVPDAKPE